jgi:hydrogenase/urease accessory protein HupE
VTGRRLRGGTPGRAGCILAAMLAAMLAALPALARRVVRALASAPSGARAALAGVSLPRARRLLLALALLPACQPALADEFRPAYLQLVQAGPDTWDVLWKLPALDESTTLRLRPGFPDGTLALTPVRTGFASGTAVQRWRIRVPGGLDGKSIAFEGLAAQRIDVLVRIARSDGTEQLDRVDPLRASVLVASRPGLAEVARSYTVLGIEHILSGADHLLFVLAMLILVDGTRRLVATITAFTAAHSLTLAGAALGFVNLPGPPVEAAIALSIVFVAAEIVHARQGVAGLTQRRPWVVAFAFGLLHGLGFAGALAEVGLPRGAIPMALLCFNVGVEIGQLLFVAAVLASIAVARRAARTLGLGAPSWLWRLPPYAIGGIASFWTIERIAAF